MKRITFFKSLLLAAGLMVGASAWADDYVFTQVASYNLEGDTPVNPFTDKSGITGRCNVTTYSDATTSSKALKFTGANLSGKTYGYQVYDFSSSTSNSTAVKIAFDFKMANQNHTHFSIRDASIAEETSKSSYSGTGSIFRFGNSRVNSANRYGYNGNAVSGANYDTWYHIEIIVDIANKMVSYTLKNIDQTTTIDSRSNLSFLSTSAKTCTQLDFFGISNAEMASIDNIVVSEYTSSSATRYSVIKYDKEGNELSSTSGLAGVSGETSSVSDADKATFYSGDTNSKYVFDATDTRNVTSMELTSTEETNVLKLYFDTYSKYTASVQPVCGENTVAAISGSWYADETPVTLYWPKVINCSDGYYVVDADASEPRYGHTFSTTDLSMNVTYTLDESIVYYTEYEDRCGKVFSGLYFSSNASKGSSRALTGSNTMTTNMNRPNAGFYNITVAGGNRDTGHTTTLDVKLKDSDNNVSANNVLTQYFNGGQWIGEMTANNVFIPAGSELYVANDNGTGNAKFAGDYIIVKKSKVSASLGTYGYATFSSTYALDFTNVTDATALIATEKSGDNIKLQAVTGTVAAGTGLILKSANGGSATVSIPVAASGTTYNTESDPKNYLFAINSDDNLGKSNNGTNYVLSVQEGKVVFAPIDDVAAPVTAGHAALWLPATATGARVLNLSFSDEDTTTGIEAVESAKQHNATYNLSGQRVAQPTKGLYIVGGKKVIVK